MVKLKTLDTFLATDGTGMCTFIFSNECSRLFLSTYSTFFIPSSIVSVSWFVIPVSVISIGVHEFPYVYPSTL